MKLSKLDFLIILLVIVFLFFGLNQERFFRVKSDNIFGAIMTHRTLVKRGYQSNVTVKGIDMEDLEFKELNGVIIDTEPDKIYFSSQGKTWVIAAEEEELEEESEDSSLRLFKLSSIYLKPTKSFKVVDKCSKDSYVSGSFYYRLESPMNEVNCELLESELMKEYGGSVKCIYSGGSLILKTKYMKFEGNISPLLSKINNSVEKTMVLSKRCKLIVR